MIGKLAPLNDAAFRLILETQYAAPLGEVATEELYRGGEALPNNEWYMTGGMQGLVSWLARGLDILLDTDVRRIAWSNDGATVRTDDAAMACDGVVLTCSVGVLKSGSSAFEPGLPTQHKQALARLEMGLLNKVALRFAAPVWPNDQEFAVLTDGPLPSIVLNHAAYSGQPVLVVLTGGHTARLLEAQRATETTAALMRTIEGALGKRLPEPEDYTVWTWGSDPYALGSYAHRRPGANLSEGATLQEPVDGRLFLAGDALAEEKPGTVAGAWLSGRHAAALISGASRPG